MSALHNLSQSQLLQELHKYDQTQAARCLLDVVRVGEVKTYLNATGRSGNSSTIKKEAKSPPSDLAEMSPLRSLIEQFRQRRRVVDIIHLLDNLDAREIQQRINLVDDAVRYQSLVAVRSSSTDRKASPKNKPRKMQVESFSDLGSDESQEMEFEREVSVEEQSYVQSDVEFKVRQVVSTAGANRSRLNVKAMTLKELCLHCVSHKIISSKQRGSYLEKAKKNKNVNLHCYLGRKLIKARPHLYFQDAGMPQLHRRKTAKKIQRAYQGKDPEVQSEEEVRIISRQKFYKQGGKKTPKTKKPKDEQLDYLLHRPKKIKKQGERRVTRQMQDLPKKSKKSDKQIRRFIPKKRYSSSSD